MAEKKLSTAEQLKLLALRSRADTVSRIAELAKLTADGLEEVQHPGITVILPASNWISAAQTIQNEFLLADSNYWYFICPDGGSYAQAFAAGVRADNVTVNGAVTFRCETTPASNLTIHILRLEVDTDEQP